MEAFETINNNNLYERIASKIEESILNLELKAGQKLPPEQKMADSFGVSRNILREAIKTLKERGLIEIKNGNGLYIAKPNFDLLKDMLNRILVLNNLSLSYLFDIRLALETKACELAAQKATQEDINKLQQIYISMCDNYENEETWPKLELDFHICIAIATKNPLFVSYLQPISDLMSDYFRTTNMGYNKTGISADIKKFVTSSHLKIIESIKEKNSKAAVQAMNDHLEQSKDKLYKYLPELIE